MARLPFVALALLVLLAGCFSGQPLDSNLTCPCAPGWTCDTARNMCVRGEIPDGGGDGPVMRRVPLGISAREAITRMTALLWRAAPSDVLLADAASTSASSNLDLLPLARRVLSDPRARVGVGAFYAQWLGLDPLPQKNTLLFPEYTKELQASMLAETQAFCVNVTLDEDGLFPTLLRATYSYVDERLAAVYGISGVTGTRLQKVDLNTNHRSGLFTQPAIMAFTSHAELTSPTSRGRFLLEKLFCREIPPHPGTPPPLGPLPAQTSTRQALIKMLGTGPTCFACHGTSDNLGFAYEGLDAIGRARDQDNGVDVDVSGHLNDGDFAGPVALSNLVTSNAAAQRCMAEQWLRFALGYTPSGTSLASLDDAARAFAASEFSLRDLIAAVLTSEAFLAP